ncbi:FHA domain-containing protein [Humibacter soli]
MLTVEHTAPGSWLAAVVPGRLAVVHRTAADDGFAARLWAALCHEDGIRLVIDELAKGGLTNAPGFVLAEWDGGDSADGSTFEARFIVRGGAGVAVETEGGSEDITARGVSTWVERPVSDMTGFRIECLPSDHVPGPALPLVVGTAWVSALTFGSLVGGFAEVAAAIPTADVDLDRTIADLEFTVAGADAPEPARATSRDTTVHDTTVHDSTLRDSTVREAPHETTGYDHLFGATMMRSVEDAAARPAEDVEEPGADALSSTAFGATALGGAAPNGPAQGNTAHGNTAQGGTALGDHDGLTVMSGDLRVLRESTGAHAQSPAPGHPGPATPASPAAAPAVPDEPGFVLQLPDGGVEPIDGMVVVGRAPSVSKMGGGRVPRLVTVDSVEHDISRNHVQLTVEGGTVVVTDLHSRNGTLIALPGKAPQKLRAGEPTSVIAGTVIDLGSGVTLGVVQA